MRETKEIRVIWNEERRSLTLEGEPVLEYALLWPQVVLFEQKPLARLRNAALFLLKRFWRVMGAGLVQLAYLTIMVLFAPWTLLLLPVTGIWYVVFLSQLLIYKQLDEDFHIEESIQKAMAGPL